MTKSVLTTLSLSFFTLAASDASPASEQNVSLASMPVESVRCAGSNELDIDLGWEQQQRLIDSRLAAKASEPLIVPGAIISSPFSDSTPTSAEVTSAGAAGNSPKPSSRGSRHRGPATNKS